MKHRPHWDRALLSLMKFNEKILGGGGGEDGGGRE